MIQTQSLTVQDFKGGIVDDYINGAPDRQKVCDNLYSLDNQTLMMRPGSVIDDLDDPQIPSGVQAIRALINYNNDDKLFVHSLKRLYYRDPSSYATLTGPTGNHLFNLGDANSVVSHTQWNGHLLMTNSDFPKVSKIYKDDLGDYNLRTAGLPALASDPSVTAGAAGARNYLYAFHYHYTYNVGQEQFQDFGPTTIVELNNSDDPSSNTNPITVIPVLANGSDYNWDTTVIKVYIYRSVDGGTTLYKIGEVTNGTTTFNDNFADSAISDNLVLYTEGGIVDNDEPPLCKFVHVVQNFAFYAYLKEGSEILEYDYLQSKSDDPDSVPSTFRGKTEEPIVGLSSVRETPIILCEKKIYRIEGRFTDDGQGFSQPVRIHDTAGCVSNNSCVQAEGGMYWCGNDGFYYTDGLRVMKVSDHINTTYKSFIEATKETGNLERIYGTFDEENRRIIWAVQTDTATADNDTLFILDLRYGVSDQMPFQTWSGTSDNFRPTALVYFNKDLHRADLRGYVFRHSHSYTTDPKVDTLSDPNDWDVSTIIYNYVSVATNFGTDFVRKWVPRVLLVARNLTNISIQINAINDDGKITRPLSEIRYRNNFVWGDQDFYWGNEQCVWNAEGLISEWRRMPAKGLRCSYMQIQITNSLTIITNSDILGTATVNPATSMATLDDTVNNDWPEDCVDYFIAFEEDGYEKLYLITVRTDDDITFADPSMTAPVGSSKWIIKGYKKGEVLNLIGLTVHWAPLSMTQTNLAGINTGANA